MSPRDGLSADARDLNWLIGNFASRTPGVARYFDAGTISTVTAMR